MNVVKGFYIKTPTKIIPMIQNHVTSLELSQKLKELGVPQKSEFYWGKEGKHLMLLMRTEIGTFVSSTGCVHQKDQLHGICSAFLSSELGEMFLKVGHITTSNWRSKGYDFATGAWRVSFRQNYGHGSRGWKDIKQFASTESDARAKMLIYLIENKLIQVESL